jgi:hypothetical protein
MGGVRYCAAMIFGLVRRVFSVACLLLVGWAALKVPVGRRTPWGHVVAIFTTEPAREAAEDLENAAIGSLKSVREGKPPSLPSPAPAPRGKTPAPGITNVRSSQQGVPASP